jgi:hypothetical protein
VGVTDRQPLVDLLDDGQLAASAVVANCAMNRERQLSGVNSYTRELGFNPVDVLTAALADPHTAGTTVAWLDLCCGTGRALIQAADRMARAGLAGRAELVGVDLVDMFDPAPVLPGLRLICAPVTAWTPGRLFDLITCVHGLRDVHRSAESGVWLTRTGQSLCLWQLDGLLDDDPIPGQQTLF